MIARLRRFWALWKRSSGEQCESHVYGPDDDACLNCGEPW